MECRLDRGGRQSGATVHWKQRPANRHVDASWSALRSDTEDGSVGPTWWIVETSRLRRLGAPPGRHYTHNKRSGRRLMTTLWLRSKTGLICPNPPHCFARTWEDSCVPIPELVRLWIWVRSCFMSVVRLRPHSTSRTSCKLVGNLGWQLVGKTSCQL